jgi:ribosomal RNA-processing protein 12
LNSCNSSNSPLIYEYITSETANYCLNLIVNNGKQSSDEKEDEEAKNKQQNSKEKKNDKQAAKKESNNSILHTLQLFKCVIHHFQVDKLKTITECLLSLMTLKDIMITSNCFQVLHQLFSSQTNNLTADLNAQIINALYDYQPSENDPPQLIGWLAVTESAIKCLNRLNKQKCITHLPHFFQIYMQILSLTHHKNIHVILTNCLNDVLEQCVQTNINLLIDDLKVHNANGEQKKSLLNKIFSQLENGLSYQFHESWLFVMKILTCAFTSFKHRDTFPVVEKCLASLANLRESDQFEYKKEADMAIGRAIQTYGPKLMLECISLEITGDEEANFDYPRSWMLPILKDNIQKTELSYFINVMLPLANKLKMKSTGFLKNKQQMQFKIFDNLVNQIWSLLPGFCDFPLDFAESFKKLAKTLGETLEKCSDLRNYVLQSLRTLVNRNSDENKVLMAKYAKNYLSIMFNVYTTEMKLEKDPVRQSLLDTIKCYMKIADFDLLNFFLAQSIQHYENHSLMYEKSLKTDLNNNNPAGKKIS